MKELLQEIQQALADLLRSGLDAAGPQRQTVCAGWQTGARIPGCTPARRC